MDHGFFLGGHLAPLSPRHLLPFLVAEGNEVGPQPRTSHLRISTGNSPGNGDRGSRGSMDPIPIGSMYGIYANIWGILMGSMLPYIAYMDPMGYL